METAVQKTMGDTSGYCWHCHSPLGPLDFSREGTCPHCGRQTHVCRNCRFYRPGLSNDCQEPVAEHVADKTRANFCDYFTPNPAPLEAGSDSSADDLRAAAEALFKTTHD
jgi:hypothetical protein